MTKRRDRIRYRDLCRSKPSHQPPVSHRSDRNQHICYSRCILLRQYRSYTTSISSAGSPRFRFSFPHADRTLPYLRTIWAPHFGQVVSAHGMPLSCLTFSPHDGHTQNPPGPIPNPLLALPRCAPPSFASAMVPPFPIRSAYRSPEEA
jgi:hypothetical protein